MHLPITCSLCLADQAVKSLCEIWHHQDIPSVFLTSSKVTVTIPAARDSMSAFLMSISSDCHLWNPQLPSPITPSVQPFPPSGDTSSLGTTSPSSFHSQPQNSLIPIKGFVHKVFRCSRTSRDVPQTPLCYLDAICSIVGTNSLVAMQQSPQRTLSTRNNRRQSGCHICMYSMM
jgi:PHO85 cyclin-5